MVADACASRVLEVASAMKGTLNMLELIIIIVIIIIITAVEIVDPGADSQMQSTIDHVVE
jgi:hypothetical protein